MPRYFPVGQGDSTMEFIATPLEGAQSENGSQETKGDNLLHYETEDGTRERSLSSSSSDHRNRSLEALFKVHFVVLFL